MVTEAEELQAKEFLKRAEIRTMRKDLLSLREVDALKERDKIAHIKTLEEQMAEQAQKMEAEAQTKKLKIEEVLGRNEGQEKIAEKDLKNYATEQERQQIFLMESQRLGFEKQIDIIDKEKDPALKLEKNKLLLKKRDQQARLNAVLAEEKKLEDEQKFITEKAQTTTIASEKKGLEQRRWDLDKEIQEVEKKRWAAEKEIEETDAAVAKIDKSSEQLVIEKNGLRDKILGVDKSLREIYSVVIARVEEQRKGQAQEQIAQREALAKVRLGEKEAVQRQQWSGVAPKKLKKDILTKAPVTVRDKIMKSAEKENEQREKFLHDVQNWSEKEKKTSEPQVNNLPPMPPVPPKKKT